MARRWEFISMHLLVAGLFLAWSARAELDLHCPDYVANHAPLVWLHSDDPYKPSDLLAHIRHTTAAVDGKAIGDLPSLDLDNLETLNKYGKSGYNVALNSNDDPTRFPQWIMGEAPDESGRIHNSTTTCVILVEKNEVEVDAFYFYFYSYNEGPNITQVLEPLNYLVKGKKASAGMHFGDHVGDWEHNMVRFHNGTPVGIYYSQHVDGMAYDWDDPKLTITDGRPIVYSARGSHANYISNGSQLHNHVLLDYCDEGQRWDPVLSAYFYRFDPETFTLTRLTPPNESSSSPPSSNFTSFFYFTGHWGDMVWPDSDLRQETLPYFGLKRFETGPTGPRHKHLVRKGLIPDHKRRVGWVEWAVGVYMKLYPYCFKGWRAWITTGVVIVALSGIVISIHFGVKRVTKRYRKTSYKKLQTDDVQLDDWRQDDAESFFSSDEEDEEERRH